MLIPIYKKTETGFEQQFITSNEPIPSGWTTELDEVNTEEELTEIEQLKQENKELKVTLEKTQEDVTNTQMAVTDLFEMIENLA